MKFLVILNSLRKGANVSRTSRLLGVSVAIITLALAGACAGHPPGSAGGFTTLRIYHTNDIHAHLTPDSEGRGGLAFMVGLLKLVRAQEPEALIVDAGDFYKKGSLPAQNSDDLVIADMMSKIKYYDARAVGNNEVKLGLTKLIDWSKTKENAPLLSANLVDKNGVPLFAPSLIIAKQGLKIGLVGMTPFVPFDESVQPRSSVDPRAPYVTQSFEAKVLPVIKSLRPRVDVLILIAHNDYKNNLVIAREHPEIDLVVSGHSHVLTPEQKTSGGNLVVEAGQFGQQLGVVTLVFDEKLKKVNRLESTSWPVGEATQLADSAMAEMVRDAYKRWAPEALRRIATSESDFTLLGAAAPFEGSLHDWVSDSFCAKVDCDVALANREMLRETLTRGFVTTELLYMAAPYDDDLMVMNVGRARFIEMLTASIERGFAHDQIVPWAFTGLSVKLKLTKALGHARLLSSVTLKLRDAKPQLKVALPGYVVRHCADFFQASDCPLPNTTRVEKLRQVLTDRLASQKVLRAPPVNRVSVTVNEP